MKILLYFPKLLPCRARTDAVLLRMEAVGPNTRLANFKVLSRNAGTMQLSFDAVVMLSHDDRRDAQLHQACRDGSAPIAEAYVQGALTAAASSESRMVPRRWFWPRNGSPPTGRKTDGVSDMQHGRRTQL